MLSVILVLVGPAPGEQGWGPAPFRAALDAVGAGGVWAVVVTIGAVAAASGALLALVAGISRTVLAMARERDLPPVLAHVSPRFSVPQRAEAAAGIADAQKNGGTDPLGAFTRLTKADAELDRLLGTVLEEQEAIKRLSRAFDQALFSAQSRVRGVSDFIDTRRGSIGPEARTRLAEAVRQLQAAQDKRATNISEAIAHANGADMLAGQAQTLASNDVAAAQRHYTSGWGGCGSGSDMGGVIGGIIIGNILSGALRGGFGGGFGGGLGMGRSTSFGGSSRSSGRSYSGGGGRF